MKKPFSKKAKAFRRRATDAERKLWAILRNRSLEDLKFRRQRPIGKYVVDFVCLEKSLIIEVDGGGHADQKEKDAERTRRLESQGYKVIRFWNDEVLREPDAVLKYIVHTIEGNY